MCVENITCHAAFPSDRVVWRVGSNRGRLAPSRADPRDSKKTTDTPKFFHQLYLASMSFCSYLSAASSQLRSWSIPLAMIRLNAAGWSLNVPMA